MLVNKLNDKDKILVAGIAFVLAGLALAIASPNGWNNVNRQPNFIGVVELAEKIKNRENIVVIDLRDLASYDEFHLPTAQHIPFEKFTLDNLNVTTVFYSGDDLLSRRLWDSLPDSMRTRSMILYGGVRDWYDRLLYPKLPFGKEVKDKALFERVHSLCQFYGGFAEFVSEKGLMDYYTNDLSVAPWPTFQRSGGLMRKGC